MTDDLSVLPPGADACWGKSVFFCPYCHGFEFADRRLGMLLRHGDALLMSQLYREWSRDLTIFTNGVPIDPVARQALADSGVPIVDDTILKFEHEDGNLRAIVTAASSTPIDALFTHPPAKFSTDIGVQLGCATKEGGMGLFFDTGDWKSTSIEGVMAAGDIARPAPSITYAVADGVMAGTYTHRTLLG